MAEISNELIASARQWLRISTTSRDAEIEQVLEACLIDLSIGGVAVIDVSDPAIQQVMKLYLKSQFGYDANASRFGQAYEFMKIALALCGDYSTTPEGESDGETG